MSNRLPNLQAGEHELRLVRWGLSKKNKEIQAVFESVKPGFREIWKTFKSFELLQADFESLTGKQLHHNDSVILKQLIGVVFIGSLKPGKFNFMNLTRILRVLMTPPTPIFNISNPVIDCRTVVNPDTEKGGQDARQTSLNLP